MYSIPSSGPAFLGQAPGPPHPSDQDQVFTEDKQTHEIKGVTLELCLMVLMLE